MKRYQIALLFFTIGIFTVTSVAVFLNRESPDGKIVQPVRENDFRTLSVFFSNSKNDPGSLNCEQTYPVERVLGRISDNEKSALGEFAYLAVADLLKGPTEQEKAQGFFTSINDGVRVQRVIIESGVAHVDFNDRLNENISGSCKVHPALKNRNEICQRQSDFKCGVQAIRSQITETLKQFPEIKEVVISVNGNSEEVLQP